MIAIPNINEGEKLDKICAALKPQARLEELKSGPENVDQAARIVLNVDGAIFGADQFSSKIASESNNLGLLPMDIGNVEGQLHYRDKSCK